MGLAGPPVTRDNLTERLTVMPGTHMDPACTIIPGEVRDTCGHDGLMAARTVQKRRIGSCAVAAIAAAIAGRDGREIVISVLSDDVRTRHFWQQHGFAPTGERDGDDGKGPALVVLARLKARVPVREYVHVTVKTGPGQRTCGSRSQYPGGSLRPRAIIMLPETRCCRTPRRRTLCRQSRPERAHSCPGREMRTRAASETRPPPGCTTCVAHG